VTNILDPAAAPALELAALYHERWEIEGVFDEFKTHLRANSTVLRSKTPELVLQELWGLLLAHFAIRQLMAQAAWPRGLDPNRLSFTNAVRVIKRKMPQAAAVPPERLTAWRDSLLQEIARGRCVSSRGRSSGDAGALARHGRCGSTIDHRGTGVRRPESFGRGGRAQQRPWRAQAVLSQLRLRVGYWYRMRRRSPGCFGGRWRWELRRRLRRHVCFCVAGKEIVVATKTWLRLAKT